MAILGNVEISGLDLSPAMRSSLTSGMSVADFNRTYSASVAGFRPIATSRQQAAPAPVQQAAPAAPQAAPAAAPVGNQYQQQADQLYGDLTEFDKAAQSPLDIYNSALESLGISDARTRVTGLKTQLMNTENLLRNVDSDVTGRTQNSLVTEAQRRRLVAMESAPIAEQLRDRGREFEVAEGSYGRILGEGKIQADYGFQGQQTKRQGLIDRMTIQRDNAKTAEEKRQWEVKIQMERDKIVEDRRQYDQTYAFNVAQANKPAASSGGGGGGGSGGSSGGGNPGQEFLSYIKGQFGSAGKNPSRQTQDAWANAWFSSKGISNAARQPYWDLFNSTYKRPGDPYKDWLYKR